jgi:hypothetical protein
MVRLLSFRLIPRHDHQQAQENIIYLPARNKNEFKSILTACKARTGLLQQ